MAAKQLTKFAEIRQRVLDFQQKADEIFARFGKKVEHAREYYSDSQAAVEIKKIFDVADTDLLYERSRAQADIDIAFEDIEKDFRTWVSAPIETSLLDTLTALNSFAVPVSKTELNILGGTLRGSYLGQKVLQQLARQNGFGFPVLDTRRFSAELTSAQGVVKTAISEYAGRPDGQGNFPGKAFFDNFTPWRSAIASEFGTKTSDSLASAEGLWLTTETLSDLTLTEKGRKDVEYLFKQEDPDKKKAEVYEILRKAPELADKLEMAGFENEVAAFYQALDSAPES